MISELKFQLWVVFSFFMELTWLYHSSSKWRILCSLYGRIGLPPQKKITSTIEPRMVNTFRACCPTSLKKKHVFLVFIFGATSTRVPLGNTSVLHRRGTESWCCTLRPLQRGNKYKRDAYFRPGSHSHSTGYQNFKAIKIEFRSTAGPTFAWQMSWFSTLKRERTSGYGNKL